MSLTPHAALVALLSQLFNDDELRAFLRGLDGGAALLHRLPAPPASLLLLADQTCDVLARHGYLDAAFFGALAGAFPRRRADIDAVASAHGFPLTPAAAPTPAPSPTPATPSPPGPSETWDVFISYAQVDREAVHTLAINLHELGLRVFLDAWELGPGDVVVHRLDAGLAGSRAGILAVSAASVRRPWVQQEYAVLLTRSVELGQRLIPVVLEDAALQPMLASRLWVDLRGKTGPAYQEALESIARALRGERRGPPPRRGALRIP